MSKMLKNGLVEFIGTFFLMFTVCNMVFAGNNPVAAPLAIGLVLAIMVYAGGFISGGHYNPAVSLGAAIRGALEWKALIPYWISQCLGAYAAVLLFKYVHADILPVPASGLNVTGAVIAELLFTFALVYVVLLTATAKQTAGNSYFGFAIGGTVTVGAYAVGGISLAAFNPAVALGLDVIGAANCPLIGATIAANLCAAVLAALVYRLVNCEK